MWLRLMRVRFPSFTPYGYDDESGVKLDEEIEPEDWYIGISGIREEEHDFCSSDSVLAWRELDDLI